MSDVLADIDDLLSQETEEGTESTETETEEGGKNETPEGEGEGGSEEESSEGEDGEKAEKPPKKEHGWQKRVNSLTRKNYEAAQRIKELEEQVRQNDRSDEPVKPDPRTFRTQRDFDIAVARYEEQVKAYDDKQAAKAEAAQAAQLQRVSTKINAEKAKYKDFDTVVSQISHVKMDAELIDLVLNDDMGIETLYFLGKNPSKAEEISTMSPAQRARTLGVISAKIAAKQAGKKVSGAPKPPSKVGGSGSPPVKDISSMSGDEYAKWKDKQKAKK